MTVITPNELAELRDALEQWDALLEKLPERVIIKCYMDTERRIRQALRNPKSLQAKEMVLDL